MNIESIISTCQSAGIIFNLSGEKLTIKGDKQAIAKHLDVLREHKDAIRENLIKPEIDNLVCFYKTRVAAAEFEGCQTKHEAEAIAYKDTALEWIYNNPPYDYTIYNCAYCCHEFDFNNCSLAAWGDVYCCYNKDKTDHLKPYLQSREREAETYLKSIGIKRN